MQDGWQETAWNMQIIVNNRMFLFPYLYLPGDMMKVDGGHKRKSNDPECVVEPEQTSDSQDYQGVLSVVVDGQHLLSLLSVKNVQN